MSKDELMNALEQGLTVHWKLDSYTIVKCRGDYWIKHDSQGLGMGLLDWENNLNIDPADCYISKV